MTRVRRRTVAAALSVGALLLSGCGGSTAGTVELPTVSSTANLDAAGSGGAAETPTWSPEQQAVLDRFMAYQTLMESFASGTPLNMKKLREVATETWALDKSQDIQQYQADKVVIRIPAGVVKAGVATVAVGSGQSRVIACVDRSKQVVLRENATQPPVADAPPRQSLIGTLVKVNEVWKVSNVVGEPWSQEAGGDPC